MNLGQQPLQRTSIEGTTMPEGLWLASPGRRFQMSVYRGVVKGHVVLLPEGADLADGAAVEVRPITPPTKPNRWVRRNCDSGSD
jgi:hypothetical protein